MDNLINRWKQTVENHNKKLQSLREESLGRSTSKDKTFNNKLQSSSFSFVEPAQAKSTILEFKNQK